MKNLECRLSISWLFAAGIVLSMALVSSCATWISSGGDEVPETFGLSGTVTNSDGGSGLAGVLITLTPGGATATTSASGAFSFDDLNAGSYTATPTLADFTFAPADALVALGPDATGVDFVGTAVPVETFSLAGTVTNTDGGGGLAGVILTLSPGGATATSGTDGAYAFADLEAGAYTVAPSLANFTFAPPSADVTLGPDATGVDFAGTEAAPDTFSIAGTVSDTNGGAALPGVTLTLTPGGATASSAADGTYSFFGLAAGAYTVTPTLTDYTFAPVSIDVTLGPNATGVDFAGTSAAPPVPTYTGDIKAIFDTSCTACHNAGFAAGGIALDTFTDVSTHADVSMTAINAGTMPPGGPLSDADKQAIADWIAGGKLE